MNRERILEELSTCKRPLFFFDDDADGLSSFLLLYDYIKEGQGVCVKTNPLDDRLLNKVESYDPDKVFILDIPSVEEDFLSKIKVPVIWIDHHMNSIESKKAIVHNPKKENPEDTRPTSQLCYELVGGKLWVAMTGIVADWVYDKDLVKKFRRAYHDLLPSTVRTPSKAMFESKIGEMGKIFNFLLKGQTKDVKKNINVLTRIKDPYEILNQTTSQGKFLYKQYKTLSKSYDDLLKSAESKIGKDKFLIFKYKTNTSITSQLSNELLYKYPNKIILVLRDQNGYYKGSLRSGKDIDVRSALEKALSGVEGHGGGHKNACGLGIKKECWETFIDALRKEL
ncbi:DHH family phosphoesterase [Candidatus Woesearchaeota archaeon]|nr:DHH family phosphoesterase [Candidatus Woesearchaeota archaeon]